ncbi:MAG: PfkB family carbohydrate kinase, partial [Nakamurella sp.]
AAFSTFVPWAPSNAACTTGSGIAGPSTVIVTSGAAGAVVVDADGPTEVPAPKVDAIDTTGAGDCFCGVLAASFAEGAEIQHAATIAVRAASLAATRLGAAEGMPRRDEIVNSSSR